MNKIILIPVKYIIGDDIYLERDIYPGCWAITKNGMYLNRYGEFEYEPEPSSNDEDFMRRFTFEESNHFLKNILNKNVLK